jgi:hypothetical protein
MKSNSLNYAPRRVRRRVRKDVFLTSLGAIVFALLACWSIGHEAYIEDRLNTVLMTDYSYRDPVAAAKVEAKCGLSRARTFELLVVSAPLSIALFVQAVRFANRGVCLPRLD